ncbi:MAG: 16S rRNA (cytosine(1402)-N(4))-methyltransferase RsmH [Acidobacteria bacterium]|nr:16S rRNA (cytosine(1402)-N(4))-methyltransferase RsmH [Acidobacteriota bacterium]
MSPTDDEHSYSHQPVLLEETLDWLRPASGGTFVDCTLGLGGHAEAMLKASPETRVIGFDQDLKALAMARERLEKFTDRFQAVHTNFKNLSAALNQLGITQVQGVLADLGVSSLQFDNPERGFSFAADAPLDMRMDQTQGETAADFVNHLSEAELADLIFEYGEERGARKIAKRIVRDRQQQPIETTKQLADLVIRALNVPGRWRIHPATRTFQAFRIAVNDELKVLESFIPAAISALASGGRLAIIAFHSLEDRLVKRAFQRDAGQCFCESKRRVTRPVSDKKLRTAMKYDTVDEALILTTRDAVICASCGARLRIRPLTRKPVRPSDLEIAHNFRSRSALLRVCERI